MNRLDSCCLDRQLSAGEVARRASLSLEACSLRNPHDEPAEQGPGRHLLEPEPSTLD